MSRFFAYKVTLALAPLAHSPGKIYSAFAYGTDLRAVLPKRTTFGKEKGGKKTKLVQKAAFPSLPSLYGFPLWTLFSLSLSLSSLYRLLTWAQNPPGLLSGLFCLWQERIFIGAVSESRVSLLNKVSEFTSANVLGSSVTLVKNIYLKKRLTNSMFCDILLKTSKFTLKRYSVKRYNGKLFGKRLNQ